MKTTPKAEPVRVPGAPPRVLVIEARFYDAIADELLAGAKAVLEAAKATIDVITVPGALEIPNVVAMSLRAAIESPEYPVYDGYIALGCVIRGETGHYDIVAGESSRQLSVLGAVHGIAIGNGILTVENEAQAFARARASELDKGGGAAAACLALIAVMRRFGIEPVPTGLSDQDAEDLLGQFLADNPAPKKTKR